MVRPIVVAAILAFVTHSAVTTNLFAQLVQSTPPKLDVAEFQRRVHEPTYQSEQLIGHVFTFDGVVEPAKDQPLVRIDGLEGRAKHMGLVRLIAPGSELGLKVGDHVSVRGLLLQEDFAVWSVWAYEWKRKSGNDQHSLPQQQDQPPDPFVGTYGRSPVLAAGGGEQMSITKEGDYYRLTARDAEKSKFYEGYRFVRASDGQLRDEEGSLGTITLGYVTFGDGTTPKPRMLKVNFCYEHFLLLDLQGGGFSP